MSKHMNLIVLIAVLAGTLVSLLVQQVPPFICAVLAIGGLLFGHSAEEDLTRYRIGVTFGYTMIVVTVIVSFLSLVNA